MKLRIAPLAIAPLLFVAACSSSSSGTTTTAAPATTAAPGTMAPGTTSMEEDKPTATSGPAQPAQAGADGSYTISVTVGTDDFQTLKGTRVVQVPKGASVTLEFTNPSAADDIHLHGYDLMVKTAKGETGKISFTADQTGQFDVESHVTNEALLVVVVA
jgi:hypothetical protein